MAMGNTRKLVCLSVLAAGGLLWSMASHALAGDAVEESGTQESSRETPQSAPPIVNLIASSRSVGATSVAGHDAERSLKPTAGELVVAVVANEISDRERLQKWLCLIEKRAGKQTLTQMQVETKEGPLYRLLAIDGTALNLDQRQQDDARIGRLLKDPRQLQKLKQAQDEDEIKLQKLIGLLPESFIYDYDGVEDNLLRVRFRPNPNYTPPTYEARVIHSLAGTILIDPDRKRLAKVSGQLMNRVDFGYGLLGRIESGTVELGRVPVGPQEWKTAFINIHFTGRLAIFKTISKDQYERRSDFRAVSSDLSLSDANALLVSNIPSRPQTSETDQPLKTP
jgi:hypothetical protein